MKEMVCVCVCGKLFFIIHLVHIKRFPAYSYSVASVQQQKNSIFKTGREWKKADLPVTFMLLIGTVPQILL